MEIITDLIRRVLRTETLVTIAALILIATGQVDGMAEAVGVIGSASTLVLGRSIVKAKAAEGETTLADADSATP
jgi:hypothetical protein